VKEKNGARRWGFHSFRAPFGGGDEKSAHLQDINQQYVDCVRENPFSPSIHTIQLMGEVFLPHLMFCLHAGYDQSERSQTDGIDRQRAGKKRRYYSNVACKLSDNKSVNLSDSAAKASLNQTQNIYYRA